MKRSLDKCQHKHLMEISYIIAMSVKTQSGGGDFRLYQAFCTDCDTMVYCQTGGIIRPWSIEYP